MTVPDNLTSINNWIQLTAIVVLAVLASWSIVRIYSRSPGRRATLVRLFALEILLIGVCVGVDSLIDSRYPLIFAIIATAVLTFFGLLLYFIDEAPEARLEDRDMRTAIAGSITIMYLVLVGYGVFIRGPADSRSDPLADTLMTTFSTVVGLVITFYFGSSAYVESRRAPREEPKTEAEGSRPAGSAGA